MDGIVLTSEMDTTMDKVVKQIYASCDIDNTNSVRVSMLIDFVKPYMPNNLRELQELQSDLDPNNSNPSVTGEVFYKAMSEWTAKIKETDSDSFNITEQTNEDLFALGHSTPRPSLGYSEFVRNCSEILNMSNISVYESENSVLCDKTALEEHIVHLEHQVKKTVDELEAVKQQLTLAEEQNETLATDLKAINKQLQREQQLTDQLKQRQQENEEITDELYSARKKIVQLEKSLTNAEKDRQILLADIEQLELKKSTLEGKLEHVRQQEQDAKMLIITMQQEIQVKDSEISTLMRITNELKDKLEDKEQLILFYKNETELAQHKTNNLQKLFEEQLATKSDRLIEQMVHDKSSSESGAHCDLDFNSPRFLDQIAHPVSPPNDSIIKKTTPPKKTAMNLRKLVLLKNTSTPIYSTEMLSRSDSPSSNGFGDSNSLSLQEELSDVSYSYHSAKSSLTGIPEEDETESSEGKIDGCYDKGNIKESDKKIDGLLQQITNQEYDKRDLWSTMKELMSEIELLKNYRTDYKEIEDHLIEKNKLIEELGCELGKGLNEEQLQSFVSKIQSQFEYEDKYFLLEKEMKKLKKEHENLQSRFESKKLCLQQSEFNTTRAHSVNSILEKKVKALEAECADLRIKCTSFEEKCDFITQFEDSAIKENEDKLKALEQENYNLMLKHEDTLKALEQENHNLILKNEDTLKALEQEKHNLILKNEDTLKALEQEKHNLIQKNEDTLKALELENHNLILKNEDLLKAIEFADTNLKVKDEEYAERVTALEEDYTQMKLKCGELEEHCVFLLQFKDSFDAMLEENETIRENCERVINLIVNRLEPHLKPIGEQRSPNLTFSVGDFTKIVSKLDDLLDLVENHMKSDEEVKMHIGIGDVCGCGHLKPPSSSVHFDPKKTNFSKQQLKIERLQEKEEEMRRLLLEEKAHNSALSLENSDLKSDNSRILGDYQAIECIRSKLEKMIDDLKNDHMKELDMIERKYIEEFTFITHENTFLKEELVGLKKDLDSAYRERDSQRQNYDRVCTDLVNNIEKVKSELNIEKSVVGTLKQSNEQLLNRIKFLECQMREEESECCTLRKKVVELMPANNPNFLQLQKTLQERNLMISELERRLGASQINERILDDVHKFMINNCEDLERTTSVITSCKDLFSGENEKSGNLLKLLNQMKTSETRFSSNIEKEMFKLSSQINLAITLLEIVTKKCSNLVDVLDERSITSDTGNSSGSLPEGHITPLSPFEMSENENSFRSLSETFHTCFSELSMIESDEEETDISQQKSFPNQSVGFLESLNLDMDSPSISMSKEKMDDTFTTLALNFTVDFSTSKVRYEKQKRRCQYHLLKFTKYLDTAIKLLKSKTISMRKNEESRLLLDVASYLEMLSGMISTLLDSSEQSGVLKCEVETMKCWNFVTNYVAVLRKDLNLSQTNNNYKINKEPEGRVMPSNNHSTYSTRTFLKRTTYFSLGLITLSFIFVVLIAFYVQSECTKFGKNALCPVDWVFDKFISEIQSNHKLTY